MRKLLDLNRVDEAEDEMKQYRKIAKLTAGWVNPFAPEEVTSFFNNEDSSIFKMPGALGEMIGPIERGWLIGILGTYKRGKSHSLLDFAVNALYQRLKVVFISLEMNEQNIKERLYKRIGAFGSGGKDEYTYPVFDCTANQMGTCIRKERVNQIRLFNEDNTLPDFNPRSEYRSCTYCRKNIPDLYETAMWFETLKVQQMTHKNVKRELNGLATMAGSNNLRIKCYPRFSASVADMERDLDILEQTEGFYADMVVFDYANIFKPEESQGSKIELLDTIWKTLAAMTSRRHVIGITGAQGTRGSIYKKSLQQDDLAEWIGVLGHTDIWLALNQTPEEKRAKIMRIGVLAHRHREFNESDQVTLLQQLQTGQFNLDSMKTTVSD
jgi:hypothetical protein